MSLLSRAKRCTCNYYQRPSLAGPGRDVVCNRELEPTVTASGTFWRCSLCDVVYTAPNGRQQ